MQTCSLPDSCGLRNKWAFGSSTSQSRSCTFSLPLSESARLVATRVLPVPPLPLATEIITLFSHHFSATLWTIDCIAGNSLLVRGFFSTSGTNTITDWTCPQAITLHSPTSLPQIRGRPGTISSRHINTFLIGSLFSAGPYLYPYPDPCLCPYPGHDRVQSGR